MSIIKFRKFLRNDFVCKLHLFLGFTYFVILLCWIVIFKVGRTSSLSTMFNSKLSNMSLWERFFNGMKSGILSGERPSNKAIKDFLLNILAFTPFGLYLPLISKRTRFFKLLLIPFLTSLFFELFQLITIWGRFNVDDLIANTFGFVIGFIIYQFIIKRLKYYHVSTINFLIILIATPISIYAFLEICDNFYFYRNLILLLPTRY